MKKAVVVQFKPRQSARSRATRPFVALHQVSGKVIRRTFASSLESAVKFSVEHLWRDSYGATKVQVVDRRTESVAAMLAKKGKIISTWRIK